PVVEGILGLCADPSQGRAGRVSRAHRQVQDAARSGSHGHASPERRAVHALDYALALASGVLLALSFPKFGHAACGWIALAPLLAALVGRRQLPLLRAFGMGLATGLLYFSLTLYWISTVMAAYGGLPMVVAILINALLVGYLALFPALFAVVIRRLFLAF